MDLELAGKIGLVTGAGSGIGRETALALAQEGVLVVLVGRNRDNLAETERMIKTNGNQSLPIVADISEPIEVQKLFAAIKIQAGYVDVAFNNAGLFGNFDVLHKDSLDNFN